MIKNMKYRNGKSMMVRNIAGKVLFATLLIKSCAFSESFVPPKNMTLFAKEYTLIKGDRLLYLQYNSL